MKIKIDQNNKLIEKMKISIHGKPVVVEEEAFGVIGIED